MKSNRYNNIFISWNDSQRSRNLAKKLSLELLAIQPEGGAFYRFGKCAIWTLYQLASKRPKTIVLQYSFLLLIIVSLYKVVNRNPIIIVCDCHTKALKRSISGKLAKFFDALKRWSFLKTNLCIIHNPEQVADITRFSRDYVVLHDAIPQFSQASMNAKKQSAQESIVFVCSYDKDEPVEEIVEAAKYLIKTHRVYLTGRAPQKYSGNEANRGIIFTGYLSDNDYQKLLLDAALIVSLTTEDACVQCAAFEALAARKAYLTSRKKSLVDMLGSAATYTENNAEGIVKGAEIALANRDVLVAEMAQLKSSLEESFENNIQHIAKNYRVEYVT